MSLGSPSVRMLAPKLHLLLSVTAVPFRLLSLAAHSNPSAAHHNATLRSLVKSGHLQDARHLFDEMPLRDVVSWTTLISGYVASHNAHEALLLFSRSRISDPPVFPDSFLLSVVLKACASSCPVHLRIRLGRPVHGCAVKHGLDRSVFVASALIDMYAKGGLLALSLHVFDEMPLRNVVSWTTVITALAQAGRGGEAIACFAKMGDSRATRDSYTFAITLKACADVGELSRGMEIHAQAVRRGFDSVPFVANSLSALYSKCGKLQTGLIVFHQTRSADVVSWTTAIAALAQSTGGEERSIAMFIRMLRETSTRPNEFTFAAVISASAGLSLALCGEQLHALAIEMGVSESFSVANAVIKMYSRVGRLHSAALVFQDMAVRDVVSWSAVISAYAFEGLVEDAFNHFLGMRTAGIDANEYVYSSLLSVCAHMAMLQQGRQLHASVIVSGLEVDSMDSSSLVNMYSKCGCVEDAWRVFEGESTENIVSWTAMINGYADHGESDRAIELFERMQESGLCPDSVLFIGVLNACSHAGMVELGVGYFYSMREIYGLKPEKEHFGCMVDLLCRAGHLSEAEQMVENMPVQFKADDVVWSILLQACRIRGDVDCGKRVADRLLKLRSNCAATLISLSNLYAAKGDWRDVADVRVLMRSKGVVKEPGSSWIAIGEHMSIFVARDRKHPLSNDIYDMLDSLIFAAKMEEYIPELDVQ